MGSIEVTPNTGVGGGGGGVINKRYGRIIAADIVKEQLWKISSVDTQSMIQISFWLID